MRILCDACESSAAIVFCAADEAALCCSCDEKVTLNLREKLLPLHSFFFFSTNAKKFDFLIIIGKIYDLQLLNF